MLEPGDRLGLGHKPGHNIGTGMKAGQDHLESAGPVQSNVARLVDDTHPASAQLILNFIAGDSGQAVRPRAHRQHPSRQPLHRLNRCPDGLRRRRE